MGELYKINLYQMIQTTDNAVAAAEVMYSPHIIISYKQGKMDWSGCDLLLGTIPTFALEND
jgi:hypothetical protein